MSKASINQFLSEISPGVLQFGNVRMALLDIESGFWSIRRQIEALIGPQLTNSVLQQAGANGGASFASSFGMANTVKFSCRFTPKRSRDKQAWIFQYLLYKATNVFGFDAKLACLIAGA